VGASTDDIAKLAKFQKATDAPQRLLSDPKGSVANAFGIAIHDQGETFAGRVTFVIGRGGKILYKVDDQVPESNVASVFAWVKQHPAAKSGE